MLIEKVHGYAKSWVLHGTEPKMVPNTVPRALSAIQKRLIAEIETMSDDELFFIVTHIEAGDDYIQLPNVIAINIVNFEYLETKDFHASFHLREDIEWDYILTKALEIHFIDMVKFRRLREKDIKNDTLQRWLAYFDRNSPPEFVEKDG
jgi:hypothetical protein